MHKPRLKKLLALLVLSVAALAVLITGMEARPATGKVVFRDNFASGKLDRYELPYPDDWTVKQEGPLHYLHMLRARDAAGASPPAAVRADQGYHGGELHSRDAPAARRRVRWRSLSITSITLHFYYTHYIR